MNALKFYSLLLVGLLVVACRPNNNDPTVDDIDNDTDTIAPMPTTDQLTETTAIPITIMGNGYSDVAEAFIRRVQQPLSDITDNTQAILVRGNDVASYLANKTVRNAIDSGTVLIIDQPTRAQLETVIDSLYQNEDFQLSMGDEEHDYHVCYDLVALNNFGDVYVLNDIFDEDDDSTTVFTLTPYLLGLHADPLAAWLNENNRTSRINRSHILTREATGDLKSKLLAQNITKTYTLHPNGDWSEKLSGRQCIFSVQTSIWVVYSFQEATDYYLIEQVILGNSQNFWIGTWRKKKKVKPDNHYQGFFLQNVTIDNKLWRDDKALSLSEGAYLIDFSPTTTNGQSSVTTTENWNFGGELGIQGSRGNGLGGSFSLSGGFGGSVGTTYSTQDMTIVAKNGSDNACNNNACWSFEIRDDNYKNGSVWNYPSFVAPPLLGREGYKTSQCWQWKVLHPSIYKNLQLRYDISFCYAYNAYHSVAPRKKWTNYSNKMSNTEYITILPPYRGEAQ